MSSRERGGTTHGKRGHTIEIWFDVSELSERNRVLGDLHDRDEDRLASGVLDELGSRNGHQLSPVTRAQLDRLHTWSAHYEKLALYHFPPNLLGRAPLKHLLGVTPDPHRLGTTDPRGPGYARPLYSSATARVPLVLKLRAGK